MYKHGRLAYRGKERERERERERGGERNREREREREEERDYIPYPCDALCCCELVMLHDVAGNERARPTETSCKTYKKKKTP